MSPEEYQYKAVRTAGVATGDAALNNAALGLAGEGGEVADHVKKYLFQGHSLDKDYLKKELGDVLWYVALACNSIGIEMSDVMEANIAKLEARYPEGKFSEERSLNRIV